MTRSITIIFIILLPFVKVPLLRPKKGVRLLIIPPGNAVCANSSVFPTSAI